MILDLLSNLFKPPMCPSALSLLNSFVFHETELEVAGMLWESGSSLTPAVFDPSSSSLHKTKLQLKYVVDALNERYKF